MQTTDPTACPFCGDELPSPGMGFMTHIDARPECRAAFDRWRQRIANDLIGGWPG